MPSARHVPTSRGPGFQNYERANDPDPAVPIDRRRPRLLRGARVHGDLSAGATEHVCRRGAWRNRAPVLRAEGPGPGGVVQHVLRADLGCRRPLRAFTAGCARRLGRVPTRGCRGSGRCARYRTACANSSSSTRVATTSGSASRRARSRSHGANRRRLDARSWRGDARRLAQRRRGRRQGPGQRFATTHRRRPDRRPSARAAGDSPTAWGRRGRAETWPRAAIDSSAEVANARAEVTLRGEPVVGGRDRRCGPCR